MTGTPWSSSPVRGCPPLLLAGLLSLVLAVAPVAAQPTVSLMGPKEAWSFNNGAEFPGATGGLSVDSTVQREGRDSLKLVGDFTRGGNYVQAGRKLDVDVRELSLWVRLPGQDRFTLRLNDDSGQTHQIGVRLEPQAGWQRVVLPLEKFFARRGQADAVPSIAKYESWGGAKDGRWHGPARGIYLLLGHPGDRKVHTLWLSDVTVVPRPAEVPGAEARRVIALDEILEGEHEWRFSRGEEFPGARGSLTVVADGPRPGRPCLKLSGDFTGGGAYVAAIRNLGDVGVKDVVAFRMQVKSERAASLSVQMVDGSGQTHQRKGVKIVADGQWHELVLEPAAVAGGEHWGGRNDGKWHGPATLLALSLTSGSDEKTKQPVVYLADVRADVLLPVFLQPEAFRCDFEGEKPLARGWDVQGSVTVDGKTAHRGRQSLLLARTLEEVGKPCQATGPVFPAAPGKWQVGLACKADLNSPDNSYNGVVTLDCLDGAGKVLERLTLTDLFGKRDWQEMNPRVEFPRGTQAARFHVQINKAHGQFWIDDLSAAYLAPAPQRDDRIDRLLFSTARLGNLLLPDDPRQVQLSVEATRPLAAEQQQVLCQVRDYWGAEQSGPVTVTLTRTGKKPGRFLYAGTLDLGKTPLEVGRYYELHATIRREGSEPFRNFTSLAILPEAQTKRYRPEQIPFTSRNWDNRLSEYFFLSDRLGLRTCGIWGGWSAQPPYKPEAPGLDLCRKLDLRALTGTPIHTIEEGKKEYDEEALRQGVRNFLREFGRDRPLLVNLGNEPHGTGERVLANVRAYQVVYEEIKKVDPKIFVVATSVEPNEEYFRAGYGKWCDAYDFHIYEEYPNVRKAIEEYRALMKKYGNPHPIWSTELGLNSQGVPRHAVAAELIKKFTTFFAAGGENASWFGLLYPDGDGKSSGSSGDSHNVFDCRYNRYCPRLDAIAYYNAVNGIAIKKFVEEKHYPEGVSAFLFRDTEGRNLQVLWKERGRRDVQVPLPGVKQVEVIRMDGSRRQLDAGEVGLTLSVSEDPLLLLYTGKEAALGEALGTPAATLPAPPTTLARREGFTLTVTEEPGWKGEIELVAPPGWAVKKGTGEADRREVRFLLQCLEGTTARELDLILTLSQGGRRSGELYWRCPLAE